MSETGSDAEKFFKMVREAKSALQAMDVAQHKLRVTQDRMGKAVQASIDRFLRSLSLA